MRELMSWELQESWSFPILELVLAVSIIQALTFQLIQPEDANILNSVSDPFWKSMLFLFAISAAVVFGRSFGESIEKRKMVVLLGYPVSRKGIFLSKFFANLFACLLVFGVVLLAEGVMAFLFEPRVTWAPHSGAWYSMNSIAPAIWGFMFLSLSLVVFFTSSLMSFLALATKRFGLSILVFLVFVFGLEYWTGTLSNAEPLAYLSLSRGPPAIVSYLSAAYYRTMGLGYMGTDITFGLFSTALCYLLIGAVALFVVSLLLLQRMDLD
jgi:ABC-type transport system involved in multi-copper enzyme maturation permease subunit